MNLELRFLYEVNWFTSLKSFWS